MNKFRTHTCGELTKKFTKKDVILSGWINKKRDHGNLLFVDLRDHYGITQCVIDKENKFFKELEKLQLETVIKVNGKVIERAKETINKDLLTGEIEVAIEKFEINGKTKELPLPVFSDQEYSEEIRLKDLNSRFKNVLSAKIDKPDDELIYALIVKNFSDSQIILDKKLINFICKRIARSYDKISEFICTIDEISLKKKKTINLKIIKEIL